ncbi:hypothetical protein [Halobacteriovorax sp. HLS]|uniref:hypothetical protein n=1 Tax=Halobacteriovorax sp. HLS TaxID=2234000 RepID=UPI000FDC53B9|nr:hypothetical protein [Halobacteriovorax sp. HLS]
MEMMIKGLVRNKNLYRTLNIFSYSTNGLPGLEIRVGTKSSRILKEKIIYLSRKLDVKIPIKRYVICVEEGENFLHSSELNHLELPILILYWCLASQISISKLDDCICGGTVSLEGIIRPLNIEGEYLRFFENREGVKVWKVIAGPAQIECRNLLRLPIEDLINLPLVGDKLKSITS